jgi:hypothetical protein
MALPIFAASVAIARRCEVLSPVPITKLAFFGG